MRSKFKGGWLIVIVIPGLSEARIRVWPFGPSRNDERIGKSDQPLRRPSAVRFHCVTLSAIMRVDFIAAWLSWA
jgi:hypothetical protein